MTGEDRRKRGEVNTGIPRWTLVLYYVLLVFILTASFFPEIRAWGISVWAYLPLPVTLAVLVLAGLAPVLLSRRMGRSILTLAKTGATDLLPIITIAVFTSLIWVFRATTHFLGDGYQILDKVRSGAELVKPWDAVTWHIQSTLYRLIGPGETAALVSLQLISVICGLIVGLLAVLVARRLFAESIDRLLFVLFVLSGGYSLIFFGYIENYPMFVMGVAAFALLGLLSARDGCARWLPAIPLIWSILLHPFGVALVPAVIYLWFKDTRIARRLFELPRTTRIILAAGLSLLVVVTVWMLWSRSYFVRFSLVPFWTDRFTVDGYTLFSFDHLLDFLNLIALLALGALIAAVGSGWTRLREIFRTPEMKFLGLLSITSLALVLVVNPRLGMARDWDLLCFAGVPLVIFCACTILSPDTGRARSRATALLAIVLGFTLLVPRVAIQADPDRALARFEHLLDLDVKKGRAGRFILRQYLLDQGRTAEAEACLNQHNRLYPQESWELQGRNLMATGRTEAAIRQFRLITEHDPSFDLPWANLGVACSMISEYDSALEYLRIADGLNPYNADTYCNLGGVYHARGEPERAESLWLDATRLRPDFFTPYRYLLRLYRSQERRENYTRILEQAVSLPEAPVEYLAEYASVLISRGNLVESTGLLRDALARGLDSATVLQMQNRNPELRVLDVE